MCSRSFSLALAKKPCHLSELHNLAGSLKRFKSDEENGAAGGGAQAGKKGFQCANVQELPISAFMWFKAIY